MTELERKRNTAHHSYLPALSPVNNLAIPQTPMISLTIVGRVSRGRPAQLSDLQRAVFRSGCVFNLTRPSEDLNCCTQLCSLNS